MCNITRDYNDVAKMHREMDAMLQGDILVTQTTDPEMMPALRKAAGAIRREALTTATDVSSPDWISEIRLAKDGEPVGDAANVLIAVRRAPEWQGVLAFDEFHHHSLFVRKPPWFSGEWTGALPVTDADEARVLVWMQEAGIHCRIEAVRQALSIACDDNRFHPIRDWLDGLAWDGTPRLDKWLTYYLGVAPIPNYTEEIGRCWLISAVARIYEPGCTAKYALILEGEQDLGKSSALEILGHPWFSDDISELGTKDAAMQVGNAWIIELSELDSTRKADVRTIKSFLSRKADKFRRPFGHHIQEYPRQCVIAGTVNPSTPYLADETGNVRMWPATCTAIDLEALKRDRDQLFAEAVQRYRAGERWYLADDESLTAAREQQEERFASDSWEDAIKDYLDLNTSLQKVTTAYLLQHVLLMDIANHDRYSQTRVGAIMTRRLKWPKAPREHGQKREYERPPKSDANPALL